MSPRRGASLASLTADLYYFFILTGGNVVRLYRSTDFVQWNESARAPFIAPDAGDAAMAPSTGVGATAATRGSPPNAHVGVPEPSPRRPFLPYWAGANKQSSENRLHAMATREAPSYSIRIRSNFCIHHILKNKRYCSSLH